jgi:hypothetical protein
MKVEFSLNNILSYLSLLYLNFTINIFLILLIVTILCYFINFNKIKSIFDDFLYYRLFYIFFINFVFSIKVYYIYLTQYDKLDSLLLSTFFNIVFFIYGVKLIFYYLVLPIFEFVFGLQIIKYIVATKIDIKHNIINFFLTIFSNLIISNNKINILDYMVCKFSKLCYYYFIVMNFQVLKVSFKNILYMFVFWLFLNIAIVGNIHFIKIFFLSYFVFYIMFGLIPNNFYYVCCLSYVVEAQLKFNKTYDLFSFAFKSREYFIYG